MSTRRAALSGAAGIDTFPATRVVQVNRGPDAPSRKPAAVRLSCLLHGLPGMLVFVAPPTAGAPPRAGFHAVAAQPAWLPQVPTPRPLSPTTRCCTWSATWSG